MRAALIAAVLLVPAAARADSGVVGAPFLTIEQGARGLGMGGAYSALADDASALWWNPAGAARVQSKEFTFSHTAYIQDAATEYSGFVMPYAPLHGALGASVTYLSMPGIDGYDASKNATGKVSASGYAAALTGAVEISSGLTVGASAKVVSQTLASNSGTGFAADAGAQYRDGSYGLGVAVQNMGPAFKIGNASDPLPRTVRGGAFVAPTPRTLVSLEEEKVYGDSARLHAGGEWAFADGLRLRAGFQQTRNSGTGAGYTAGFGVAVALGGAKPAASKEGPRDIRVYKPFWDGDWSNKLVFRGANSGGCLVTLDYAFVSDGDLTDVHRVSLSVRF